MGRQSKITASWGGGAAMRVMPGGTSVRTKPCQRVVKVATNDILFVINRPIS